MNTPIGGGPYVRRQTTMLCPRCSEPLWELDLSDIEYYFFVVSVEGVTFSFQLRFCVACGHTELHGDPDELAKIEVAE